MSDAKIIYLERFYATVSAAALLAYFPPSNVVVRFLCIMAFGILAGWTERASLKIART